MSDPVALYRSGLTLRQVAAELGVSYSTVRRRLKDAGIERRDSGWPKGRARVSPKAERNRNIRAALAAGATPSVLAPQYGITASRIVQIGKGKS